MERTPRGGGPLKKHSLSDPPIAILALNIDEPAITSTASPTHLDISNTTLESQSPKTIEKQNSQKQEVVTIEGQSLLNKPNIALTIPSLIDGLDITSEAVGSGGSGKERVPLQEQPHIIKSTSHRVYYVNGVAHEYYTNTKSIAYSPSLNPLEFCPDTGAGISLIT